MAEYNPSKIIKDGNTYNFRDTTKIPLAGSNQISGDLIPATDNSIDIGSSTKNLKMLYTKGITIDGKTVDTDANGNLVYDGNIVDTIEEQGNEYIRYSNGLQICYGEVANNNNIETGRSRHSYPMAFIAAPSVVATPRHYGIYFVTVSAVGTTNWQLNSVSAYDDVRYTGDGVLVSYVAIGKWK